MSDRSESAAVSLDTWQRVFQSAFEAVPNAIVVVNQAGTIVVVNAQTEALFGYSRSDLVGQPIETLVPQRYRAGHPRHVEAFFATPRSIAIGAGRVLTGQRKSGSEFPVEIGLSPISTSEGTLAVGSIIDLTQQKRAEDHLAAYAAELERRNRELDEYTYVASHDLQEPLRKLISFSELLKQDLGEDLSKQAEQDLGFIVDAADRMRSLVQDLLTLSRTGNSEISARHVSVDLCLDQALEMLELSVRETGAAINRDELPDVLGDPTLLTQLFQNLIANALKFTNPQTAPEIRITAEQDRGSWVFGVCDNGIGVSPAYADRIFAPFKRLAGQSKASGSGIGLAICRKVVERHGGRIWVEPADPHGAHFRFTLAAVQPGSIGSAVVLLVDDDHGDQVLIERALRNCGVETELYIVGDGQEALDYLHRKGAYEDPATSPRPDLILLDLNMPGMDGREFLERLNQDQSSTSGIPIIVLTTSKRQADITRCHELGCRSVVTKPVDTEPFAEAIRGVAVDALGPPRAVMC